MFFVALFPSFDLLLFCLLALEEGHEALDFLLVLFLLLSACFLVLCLDVLRVTAESASSAAELSAEDAAHVGGLGRRRLRGKRRLKGRSETRSKKRKRRNRRRRR